MIRASVTVRRLPRAGSQAEEDEDAAFPNASALWTGAQLRCAVADGASEALLSGPWAALLVRLYGQPRAAGLDPAALLARAAGRWQRWLRLYLRRRARAGRPVQWFEEPGLAAGAFAALLGVTLTEPAGREPGAWTALGLGDSCLYQVRAGELMTRFPLLSAAEFGVRPLLIGSRPDANERVRDALQVTHGTWQAADRFYLMTDALAHWFVREHEAGGAPWETLDMLTLTSDEAPFAAWVADGRQRQRLRNDDVTLLRIELVPESVTAWPGRS